MTAISFPPVTLSSAGLTALANHLLGTRDSGVAQDKDLLY